MAVAESYFCEKCKKTMGADQFYGTNNKEKYPTGKLNRCKKCITMHIDNWNPDTYTWIMQECDVPYVPDEWDKLMAKYARDPDKMTGLTIFGKYLSKMKLKQFKEYRWKDSDFLQQLENNKIEQSMKRQGYDAQQIAVVLNERNTTMPTGPVVEPIYEEEPAAAPNVVAPVPGFDIPYPDYFAEQSGGVDDFVDDLTDEDKKYLRLKWGKTYKPSEWVELEKLYKDMVASYEINTAGHVDILKKACKTSLKADQLLDIGDIDGAQKMIKMYDAMMKAGKFQAIQNKSDSHEFVNSISELVLMCEKEGFIPRYYVDEPKDKVDYVIKDMQDYTSTLVKEEMHLGALIEKAIKTIEEERIKDLENEIDDISEEEAFEQELFSEKNKVLADSDFMDFGEFEDEQEALNTELFDSWGDDE